MAVIATGYPVAIAIAFILCCHSCRFIVYIVNHAIQIDPGGDSQLSFIVVYPSLGTLVTTVYKHTPDSVADTPVASESHSQAFFGSHISFLHVFSEGYRTLYTTTLS